MVKKIYKVTFLNQGRVYEVFASNVYQGDLYGFVVVEDLLFGERSSIVVDPSEERLKSDFEHVTRTHIPMHAVIRIDEVKKQGVAKISDFDGKIAQFPTAIYPSDGGGAGKN